MVSMPIEKNNSFKTNVIGYTYINNNIPNLMAASLRRCAITPWFKVRFEMKYNKDRIENLDEYMLCCINTR